MLRHIINTWLLAHLIHSVLLVSIAFFLNKGESLSSDDETILACLIFFSILVSSPYILISYGILVVFTRIDISITVKFFLWLLGASIIILAGMSAIYFYVEERITFKSEILIIALPAIAAAWIAIAIRWRQFKRLFQPVETENAWLEGETRSDGN
jgi:hypothetical protein